MQEIGIDIESANGFMSLYEAQRSQRRGPSQLYSIIAPRSGSQVRGVVVMFNVRDGVRLMSLIGGLTPNQEHGFHVHEKGNCDSSDAVSAGGHFNPTNVDHGDPSKAVHHAGDMGNVKANFMGSGTKDFLIRGQTLAQLSGKAVIVHEKRDDLGTANLGNAGPRVGCGVIGPDFNAGASGEAKILVGNLVSPAGKRVISRIEFTETPAGLAIKGKVEGLTPNGKHGVHIHENPASVECVGTFTEVGGHFNPSTQPHGNPADAASHAGDLGNLTADATGIATLNVVRSGLTLRGATGVLKRAIIVHMGEDDLKTQPTGNSGDRIACAIIK